MGLSMCFTRITPGSPTHTPPVGVRQVTPVQNRSGFVLVIPRESALHTIAWQCAHSRGLAVPKSLALNQVRTSRLLTALPMQMVGCGGMSELIPEQSDGSLKGAMTLTRISYAPRDRAPHFSWAP